MSLFKRKETSFEDMDSRDQLKKIMEQLGFLEKKLDTVLESLGGRGGRQFGANRGGFNRDRNSAGAGSGGGDRGGFRGGNRDRGGMNNRHQSGNTRYGGQGPQRYNPRAQYGAGASGGSDDNRGNFGGDRGGNRHEGGRNRHQGGGRHQQGGGRGGNMNPNVNPNGAAPQPEASSAPDDAQPE